jgi:CheY-like chemotaxis protein
VNSQRTFWRTCKIVSDKTRCNMIESCCVLIVDDNEEIVHAAKLRLRAAGFDTLSAYDGAAGVASAVTNLPDAIVLDVQMPVMDGLKALATLHARTDTRNIPVSMRSASIVDKQPASDAGARFFLKKPCDGVRLVNALTAVMKNGHAMSWTAKQNRRGLSQICAVLGANWDCPPLRGGFVLSSRSFRQPYIGCCNSTLPA